MIRVLLLDDDGPFSAAISRSLRAGGMVVEAHTTLESFLEAVNTRRHDVLLIDWNLRTSLGTAACAALRATGETRAIAIISGAIDPGFARDQADEAGASDFIDKTASVEEWRLRVTMLARSPAYRGRPTRSGVHRLDERVHAAASLELRDGLVILGEHHVTVRPMEYKVLEYLVAHAGTVVSSNELIAAIWKEPNTQSVIEELRGRLSTTMNRLRKALGASSVLIETVRGGYLVRSATSGDQGTPSLRVDVRRL